MTTPHDRRRRQLRQRELNENRRRNEAELDARRRKFGRIFRPIGQHTSGQQTIICGRVTTPSQARKGNLADGVLDLCLIAAMKGIRIVNIERCVGDGTDTRHLRRAAKRAKRLRASLLALSVNRFIRTPKYHPKNNPDAEPSKAELLSLAERLGVKMFTVVPPEATNKEQGEWHTRRGLRLKGAARMRDRGRQPKKRRRCDWGMVAWVLHHHHKMSYGQIAKDLGLPRSTVQEWANSAKILAGVLNAEFDLWIELRTFADE